MLSSVNASKQSRRNLLRKLVVGAIPLPIAFYC
jgi:hypothetical protein